MIFNNSIQGINFFNERQGHVIPLSGDLKVWPLGITLDYDNNALMCQGENITNDLKILLGIQEESK